MAELAFTKRFLAAVSSHPTRTEDLTIPPRLVVTPAIIPFIGYLSTSGDLYLRNDTVNMQYLLPKPPKQLTKRHRIDTTAGRVSAVPEVTITFKTLKQQTLAILRSVSTDITVDKLKTLLSSEIEVPDDKISLIGEKGGVLKGSSLLKDALPNTKGGEVVFRVTLRGGAAPKVSPSAAGGETPQTQARKTTKQEAPAGEEDRMDVDNTPHPPAEVTDTATAAVTAKSLPEEFWGDLKVWLKGRVGDEDPEVVFDLFKAAWVTKGGQGVQL